MTGLWYILLITIGVCFVLTIAHNMRKDPNKMARLRRLHSALRWSNGGAHAQHHGTVDGSFAGHYSGSGWSAGTPSAPPAAPAAGGGAASQAAGAAALGLKAGPRLSRLGSVDVTTWWGQGPAAAKPAFMQMFSRSPAVTLSRCAPSRPHGQMPAVKQSVWHKTMLVRPEWIQCTYPVGSSF